MVQAVNAFQHAKATLDRRAAEAQQAQSVAEAELHDSQHQLQEVTLQSTSRLQVRPWFQSRFLLVDRATMAAPPCSNIAPVGDKEAVSVVAWLPGPCCAV